jgi:hypothetical protein
MIYLVSSHLESLDISFNIDSQIKRMLFAKDGIVYVPLGIQILKNNLHNRMTSVIPVLVSDFMLLWPVIYRNFNRRLDGILTEICTDDLVNKTGQIGIIAFSFIMLMDLKKHQILSDLELFASSKEVIKRIVS